MSIIKANGAGEVSTGFYNFEIDNSLRFDDGSSPVLTRASSDGNRDIFTFSAWAKRGDLSGSSQIIWESRVDNDNRIDVRFVSDNTIQIFCEISNSTKVSKITNQLFRDISSWYHIVVVGDTSDGTQADRIKLYVNGSQITSFSTNTNSLTSNQDLPVNVSTATIGVGANASGTAELDGYLADVNYIDGTALTPSSFGETKSGVWIPKDTSGLTFGTNGFRLEFKQTGTGTASSSTIGADTSGNDSHYTSTNLGAFDVMPDSPTNNFAVINSLIGKSSSFGDPRHGNLEMDTSDSGRGTTFSTLAMSPGTGEKYYAEYRYRADSGHMRVGVIAVSDVGNYLETSTFDDGTVSSSYISVTGQIFVNGSAVYDDVTYTVGNVIGIALDLENGSIEYFKDGTSIHSESNSIFSSNSFLFAAGDSSNSKDIRYSANFGQDSTFANDETAATNADTNGIGAFHTAVPSGFKALCTANLPEPPITPLNDDLPEDYFNTVLYAGNSADRNIEVGFKSDLIWVKSRDTTDNHRLYNVTVGEHACLFPNVTSTESTATDGIAFDFATGFNIDDGVNRQSYNKTGEDYVSWNWLAGGTPSATNSAGAGNAPTSGSVMIDGSASTADLAGTIPATKISANTEAGFSVVSYTGNNGSSATIAHGLGSVPAMIIVKDRDDSSGWVVYHKGNTSAPETNYLVLNTNASTVDDINLWNDTAPTSSVFSVGGSGAVNDGTNYIAYVFAEIEGYQAFGGYNGNGSSQGQYIYTGFRPSWIMLKAVSGVTASWVILDNKRDVINPTSRGIFTNLSNAEASSSLRNVDFLSNGFKLRTNHNNINGSGDTYLYWAIAEMPTKYANAK